MTCYFTSQLSLATAFVLVLLSGGCAAPKSGEGLVASGVTNTPPPLPTPLVTRHSPLATALAPSTVQVLVARQTSPPPAVTLAWDPSLDPTVTGYNVYYGTNSRAYQPVVNAAGNTSLTISNLSFGVTYFFAATTYNAAGLESDYSSEVVWISPAALLPPGNLRIQSFTAQNANGPWLPDTNWPPVLVSNPLGNQFWKLEATPLP